MSVSIAVSRPTLSNCFLCGHSILRPLSIEILQQEMFWLVLAYMTHFPVDYRNWLNVLSFLIFESHFSVTVDTWLCCKDMVSMLYVFNFAERVCVRPGNEWMACELFVWYSNNYWYWEWSLFFLIWTDDSDFGMSRIGGRDGGKTQSNVGPLKVV